MATCLISDKLLSQYKSGLFTAAEVADYILNLIINSNNLNNDLAALFDNVPAEIKNEFITELRGIKKNNYHYTPLMIGGESALIDPSIIKAICTAFKVY